ncbi:MAG: hypothetical protein M3495_13960, partial [Pseudomonadota bacterium]|nr:hypothetical protein [Pseudomonadota bacterium]
IQHRHKRSVLRLDLLYRGRNLHPALKHISHTLSSYFCAMPKGRVRWRRREREVAMGHAETIVIGNEGVAGQHLG